MVAWTVDAAGRLEKGKPKGKGDDAMNKTILLLLVCVCGLPLRVLGDQKRTVEREALRIQNMRICDVTRADLPIGLEKEVVEELRKRKDVGRLLRIRDPKSIDAAMAKFKVHKGLGPFIKISESCSPWILPELKSLLYLEDKMYYRARDDYDDYGYSMRVSRLMLEIIATSPEVPEEIRTEAEKFCDNARRPYLIRMMRSWWETNEEALRSERYEDLTAPRSKGFQKERTTTEKDSRPLSSTTKTIQQEPAPSLLAVDAAENTPPAATEHKSEEDQINVERGKKNSLWFPLLTLFLVVSMVVFVASKWRRSVKA